MNKIKELFEEGEIETYIAVAFLIVIVALEVFGLATPHYISVITLSILGYVVIGNLRTQKSIPKVSKDIQKIVSKLDEDTKNSILKLEKVTNNTKICRSYEEVMVEVARLVFNPKNKNQSIEVYIYKAYDISIDRERRYFKETIEAINKDYIDNYNRIITLNSSEEVKNLIEIMKLFSESEKARQAKFFVNYRPTTNYISFVIVSNGDCFIGLPRLSNAPWEIKGHQCGVFVTDDKVFQSFKEIFQTIRDQKDFIELIPIPDSSFTDDDWEKLRLDIERKRLDGKV
jgi:hypothetical protein